jgi:general secretion pathway protein F/type IV pilus assembly protein PilC
MPSFTYTAIDVAGKQVSGNLVVRNKSEAYRELESKTLTPITVFPSGKEVPTRASRKAAQEAGPAKLKRPELVLFTEELADLLDAGMQLERALKILHDRQANKSIKAVSGILRDEIREGARFSKALAKASPSFDELYRSLCCGRGGQWIAPRNFASSRGESETAL